MKNIINEKPTSELHGRLHFSASFVEDKDIQGKKILDIGCGYGWFEINVLDRQCALVVGLEQSELDLITAKKFVQHPKAIFAPGSAIKLEFAEGAFDTVVAWEVLEHIPRKTEQIMFNEANRVLKKGGYFYLSTPHRSILSNLLDPAWLLIGHRHYQIDGVREFAGNAGFEIEQCEIRGGIWELIGINNLYFSKWILRRPPIFAAAMNRLIDREFSQPHGFTNIFLKLRKI